MKLSSALLFVGFFHIVSGSPEAQPGAVTHLKYDTRSEMVYMYRRDGSLQDVYTKRQFNDQFKNFQTRDDGSSCNLLSADDAKKMPGWSKLEAFAKASWGNGKYNLVTNPEQYPDAADTGNVQLVANGPPSCNNQTSDVQGNLSGTKGKVTLSHVSTSSISGSWSVTSSFMEGSTISVGIEAPEDGPSLGVEFTQSATITNEQSKSFSASSNATNTEAVQVDSPDGKDCTFTIDTQTCSQDTKGSLPIVATGWAPSSCCSTTMIRTEDD